MERRAKHILAVDDDRPIRELLTDYLGEVGFKVTALADGSTVCQILDREAVDLIILDLVLPGIDGVTLARTIRSKSDVPIIMLTARNDEIERVVALEVGADDYVSKPFSPRELLARIKSVLRRIDAAAKTVTADDPSVTVSFADWELNLMSRRLSRRDGTEIKLTNSEFGLLSTFVKRPQRVLSRDQLLEYSRADPDTVFDRSIDYLILRLRRKIERDARKPQIIRTEHGSGYIFTVPVTRSRGE